MLCFSAFSCVSLRFFVVVGVIFLTLLALFFLNIFLFSLRVLSFFNLLSFVIFIQFHILLLFLPVLTFLPVFVFLS